MKAFRIIACSVALAAFAGGCVQRQLTVTSDPPGALVYLNDREAGRTPFTTDFTWYGTYDVVVRKEGYETLITRHPVRAPWWQYMPFDLVAEMAPWRPVDRHQASFTLAPVGTEEAVEAIVARGLAMQRQLPATQPAQ